MDGALGSSCEEEGEVSARTSEDANGMQMGSRGLAVDDDDRGSEVIVEDLVANAATGKEIESSAGEHPKQMDGMEPLNDSQHCMVISEQASSQGDSDGQVVYANPLRVQGDIGDIGDSTVKCTQAPVVGTGNAGAMDIGQNSTIAEDNAVREVPEVMKLEAGGELESYSTSEHISAGRLSSSVDKLEAYEPSSSSSPKESIARSEPEHHDEMEVGSIEAAGVQDPCERDIPTAAGVGNENPPQVNTASGDDDNDEEIGTPADPKRIEISLSEAPRLTFVASEAAGNLTSTSFEFDNHQNSGDSNSNENPPSVASTADKEEAEDIPGEDRVLPLAEETGEYVASSRELGPPSHVEENVNPEEAESFIGSSEEAQRANLKSKSFTTPNKKSVSFAKTTERSDVIVGDDEPPQYMSLPQDEHLETSSPTIATQEVENNGISYSDSSSQSPDIKVPVKDETVEQKGGGVVVLSNEQSGGGALIHSKSLDVITPTRSSLRPTLSYDGASFYLPTQEVKIVKNSVMPNAPPGLMNLIDDVVDGWDDTRLAKLQSIVSDKEYVVSPEKGKDARLVVDILIAKLGGVEGLDEKKETTAPRVILRAGPAIAASKILPWLPWEGDTMTYMSPRTRMAKSLALVLQACTRNRAMCSAAGLLRTLLLAAQEILTKGADQERWDPTPLFDAFEALGSHCLTVLDLREWLRTVAKTFLTGKALDLILTLERSLSGEETRGPSHTFEFDGASSGLLGPGESRWPFPNGYAFATWLYIESFADTVSTAAAAAAIAAAASVKSGRSSAMSAAAAATALAGEGTAHMPRLFSFLSLDSLGVEAYFHGQFLVVDCVTGKGKKSSIHFTYPFKLHCWYFIGLEHTFKQGLLGKAESEMKLYIDGRLCESRPLLFPRPASLGFCCIGTNPPPAMAGLQKRRLQCPLFAEMGPIYIFKEPIGLEKMTALSSRGGDALSSFGAGAGVPWFANNEQAMSAAEDSAALDLEIGPSLHLLYHPKLLVGRSCQDASPNGASGKNVLCLMDYIYFLSPSALVFTNNESLF